MTNQTKRIRKTKAVQELSQIEKDLQLTMSLNDAIDKIQTEYNVSIGLQLDTQKIKKIIDFMIDNQLTTVSLKYEIWKINQQPVTSNQ